MAIALFWPILTPTRRVGVNSIFVAVIDTNELVAIDTALIFTRCAYAQGRVKRLSPSIYLFVCVCVDVCVVKKHGCLLSYRSKIATK